MKPALAALIARPIAHRGLHDGNHNVWENTLSAFSRAIDGGFAIECDLQYASDGEVVVFHDDDLERLCRIKGDVRDKTSAELGMLAIGGTADKVPTLKALLKLVAGRVPLVLELKGREGDDDEFAASVVEALEGYQGSVCLMSFDHWLLRDLVALESPFPVGLTAEGDGQAEFDRHEEVMSLGLDFISYYIEQLPNDYIAAKRARQIPVITWTVRNREQAAHSAANADQITFEGFDPQN